MESLAESDLVLEEIDTHLLELPLTLSPEERVLRHEGALALYWELRISRRAVSVPRFGFSCKVISIEDLIAAKNAMGREKDMTAIRELELMRVRRRD